MIREFPVPASAAKMRLDQWLAMQLPELSRAYLQKLIKAGAVQCGGSALNVPKTPLVADTIISVSIPEIQTAEPPAAEEFTFPLLFEDPFMAVIDKPAGVVVHPAPGNPDGTVVNAILSRYPELRSPELPDGSRPGIVHRLDKDTSGCLVIARTPEAQAKLCAAFAARETKKCYVALALGTPPEERGRIENLIGRHPVNRQKMAIVERSGKPAVSEYEVLKKGRIQGIPVTLFKVRIFTGRTHQIRVHLASLGCPVLGDEVYGGARRIEGVPRQMLHAWKLAIPHPVSGELLQFTAPVPEDLQRYIKAME